MSDPDRTPADASTVDRSPDAGVEPEPGTGAAGDADAAVAGRSDAPAEAEPGALRVAVETDVPPGEPVHECGRCGRPFVREEHLVLHRGLAHYGDLTDAERDAFAAAYDDERAEIRRFRIVALGGLVLLYFGFLLAYALVG